jgi:hypothetical protein
MASWRIFFARCAPCPSDSTAPHRKRAHDLGALLKDGIKTIGDLEEKVPAFAESPAASASWIPVPRS